MKRIILIASLIILGISIGSAATITGAVQDQMQKIVIEGALIILQKPGDENFGVTTTSEKDGRFILSDVRSGVYNIEAGKTGYFKNVLFDLKVEGDRNYSITIKLLRQEGKSSDDYCFMLGGIEVCSEQRELIPEEPITVRRIESGEIEHMQATNLGDVLALVPGIEKSQNPGLAEATKVGLRTISLGGNTPDALETFGSVIIIDGNRLANEANMTTKVYSSSGESGIDLRTIPADNIKSIEVITGIPSVEYGNFSNGIIKVETKTGIVSPKLKAKINPDTKTASFSHGFRFKKSLLDYHLNYGYSERDLRKDGDEYHRLHANATYARDFLDNKLNTELRGSFTKMIDNERPTDVTKMSSTNNGYLATANLNLDYARDKDDIITGFIGFNLNRKNAYKQKWVAEQLFYNDSLYPGYFGKYKEIGDEWDFNARVKRNKVIRLPNTTHEILTGIDFDYQKNKGDGLIIDPVWNYYGVHSSEQSYAFDDFPEMTQFSLYAEDDLKGHFLGKKYNLIFGLRYDAFNPTGPGSSKGYFLDTDHGEFFSPRMNLQYFFSEKFRVRVGAGKSAKAVSLGYMFDTPKIVKYLVDNVLIEEPMAQYNPELQTYTSNKYELSFDYKPMDVIGFSLTGYYSTSKDRPVGISYPFGYSVNPDTITSNTYSIKDNRGWQNSSGVEFTLRTKRFSHFQYRMNVTYRFSESGRRGLAFDSSPDTTWENIWYQPSSNWYEKVIIDYQLNYINQRLGAWVTLEIQQIPLENHKEVYHSNSKYKVVEGFDEPKLFYQTMTEWYEKELDKRGGRMLINLRITKSIARNTELSLYINNLFDDRALWKNPFIQGASWSEQNPPIYYGLEVSTQW